MPVTKVVRYRTNPQDAAENARLIRDVFAELAAEQPEGLRYASYRLDDGVSFLHVAELGGEDNPLARPPGFPAVPARRGARRPEGPRAGWPPPDGLLREAPALPAPGPAPRAAVRPVRRRA